MSVFVSPRVFRDMVERIYQRSEKRCEDLVERVSQFIWI